MKRYYLRRKIDLELSTKKLLKGTSIYTFSNILINAGSLILLPIFTLLLTPEEYGIIGLLNPVISFMPMFFIFGLYVAQTRIYVDVKNDSKKLGSYIYSLNIFLWIVNIIIFLLLIFPLRELILGNVIDFNKVPFYPYVLLALVIGFISIFNRLAQNYYAINYNFKKKAIGSILSFVIANSIALFLIYYYNFDALGKFIGMAISNMFLFFYWYLNYIKKASFSFDINYLKDSLNIGFPVMAGSITGLVLNYSDRIVLSKFLTLEVVGIYSLAYSGGMILNIIINSFNSVWLPMFNELMDSNNKQKYLIINKKLTQLTLAIVFICLLGQLFNKEIITFVLPENYNDTILFLPYILFGIVFEGINHFFKNIFIYYKDTIYLPILTFLSAMLNLGINIIFIPKFGSMVAVYSTIISYLFITLLLIFIIKFKYKNFKFNYWKLIFILLFALNPILIYIINMKIGTTTLITKVLYLSVFIFIFGRSIFKTLYNFLYKKNNSL